LLILSTHDGRQRFGAGEHQPGMSRLNVGPLVDTELRLREPARGFEKPIATDLTQSLHERGANKPVEHRSRGRLVGRNADRELASEGSLEDAEASEVVRLPHRQRGEHPSQGSSMASPRTRAGAPFGDASDHIESTTSSPSTRARAASSSSASGNPPEARQVAATALQFSSLRSKPA
jgi:hypothetical protein